MTGRSQTKFSAAGIVMDTTTWQATINEQPIALSQLHWDILEFFVRYPDRFWTADMLYDRIWGLDDGYPRTNVTVAISAIRQTLEEKVPERVLWTAKRKGRGYILTNTPDKYELRGGKQSTAWNDLTLRGHAFNRIIELCGAFEGMDTRETEPDWMPELAGSFIRGVRSIVEEYESASYSSRR